MTDAVSVTTLVVAQSVRFSASQAVSVASMVARPGWKPRNGMVMSSSPQHWNSVIFVTVRLP